MKNMLKFLFLLPLSLLAGCKLAVIVVEGGEVQSTGSGTCVAGTICLVNVADTNFYETFTAIPEEGWYFHKWNHGDRFFCGNSSNPECSLSFEGLQGEDDIEALLASSEMFYLMPEFKDYPKSILAGPRIIEVDGKQREWLQPTEGDSYNQISSVCPKGVCYGNLPGSTIDLTGYRWASSDDVRLLISAYKEAGIPIARDFEEHLFDITHAILGVVRDKPDREGQVSVAVVYWANQSGSLADLFFLTVLPEAPVAPGWFWRQLD